MFGRAVCIQGFGTVPCLDDGGYVAVCCRFRQLDAARYLIEHALSLRALGAEYLDVYFVHWHK